ncbi:hypothetical protein L9Y56_004758 [Klebsiella pneumoniae]|uniref:hypothetical protein n=1 Tax=Klebsiella pneumoniae TaxID=573 RepID=UPI0020A7DEBB|nr:hypothetical protein [Klebsiella pneumoniae]EKT9177063.1 hypothetical protein [Klebsiella pneumoniae]EKU3951467.1 hypothetical protein [Klebsiella pneumoniae]EKU8649890.1 hypothetical protein [Klebsiella pneumoniae]EKV3383805.1 hypothetical protein [Klebsiella pneumoniae]EKV3417571.1 hypothetical protein [Klebsiella pneumoniae]
MTDITELAQREKFEAWFKSSFHPDKTGPYIKDQLYFAWKAAGAELVDAVEKAQQRISELESRTVTVKLTDINDYLAEVHDKTLNRAFRLLAEGVRAGDVAAMRAAGIKVEAE